MFRVGVKNRLRARHFLIGDFGEETRPHEHEYALEWVCCTAGLDENGFAVNIALMEELLAEAVRKASGTLLNELPFFKDCQPSVENMARYLHRGLLDALEAKGYPVGTILESELTIWESDTAWAAYRFP
jgi:6-pyruvoyl-tetrahydropterin synthase